MRFPDDAPSGNLLINAMSPDDLALLQPHLERVKFEREQILSRANQPIEHIYFPESGIASIVSIRRDSGRTEVGIFGRDGMSGPSFVTGIDRTPHEIFVQVEGASALRIASGRLREAVDKSKSLRTLLLAFAHTIMIQTAACAVGNAHHSIEGRLSRWLLMCHDRVDGDEIHLTHEFMAMMIASQRSGVTITLHVLEGVGAIRSKRGRVIILDRAKLEDLAGDAYGEPEGEYRRLIAPFGREGVVISFDPEDRAHDRESRDPS